jgi:transposase
MGAPIRFEQPAQEATLWPYLHEVEHVAARIGRLERAAEDAVKAVLLLIRVVIKALQVLCGVAQLSAVTFVAELGQFGRFATARPLMGYSGAVPSENSSGERMRPGAIANTGNGHVRRVVEEAAWAYRHRPAVGPTLRKRQAALPEEAKAIAWQAQHRLYRRNRLLSARGTWPQRVVTALARESLGFVCAIGVTVEARTVGQRAA